MLRLVSAQEDKMSMYTRANGYLAKGSPHLAEELYYKLIALDESGDKLDQDIYADILHNLGMIAEKKQDSDMAIYYYRQSVAKNHQRSLTWIFLAKVYFNKYEDSGNPGDLKSAIAALQEAESFPVKYPIVKILKEKYA